MMDPPRLVRNSGWVQCYIDYIVQVVCSRAFTNVRQEKCYIVTLEIDNDIYYN